MSSRKIYHVLPQEKQWAVKIGKAKRASLVLATKEKAIKAASNLAKSSPTAQVVIHQATGVIAEGRSFGLTDFKKKKKVRAAVGKAKKTKTKNKVKEWRLRTEHRKAANLGLSRLKRAHYARSAAAKKAAKTRASLLHKGTKLLGKLRKKAA